MRSRLKRSRPDTGRGRNRFPLYRQIARFGKFRFGCKDVVELAGGFGPAEEPALAEVAAEGDHDVCLFEGFNAFGDDVEAQAVAEVDDGGDDLVAVGPVGHGGDEAAIDLEQVEGEGLEVAEAGVSGAEVVEGEAAAKLFEPGGDLEGGVEVVDEAALGELDDEAVKREAGACGELFEEIGEGEVAELDGRDVDADAEVRGQVDGGGEGVEQDVGGELIDPVVLFGGGDEAVGRDEAEGEVVPAGEEFEAVDLAGVECDQRLEVGSELAFGERASDVCGGESGVAWEGARSGWGD